MPSVENCTTSNGACSAASKTRRRVPAVVAAAYQGLAVAGGFSSLPPMLCAALPESELRLSLTFCSATLPGSSRFSRARSAKSSGINV